MTVASADLRILQLWSTDSDFQTSRGVTQLGALGRGFNVVARSIGSGGDWRSVPNGASALLRDPRWRGRRFDVVHAWGLPALAATALGAARSIVYTPIVFPTARSLNWLRAIMHYRNLQVICPTATMRRRLVEGGVPLERCHLIRPGVDFARVKRRRDPALRHALDLADDDRVLLLAGESTPAAGHVGGTWAASILNELDSRYKVLIWGRGGQSGLVLRFACGLHKPWLARRAEQSLGRSLEFEELLPAADAIVISAVAPAPTLPMAIAMASALPIAATVTATTSELLEDRHTALMCRGGSPRELARRIMELFEDSSRQWSISDMARAEAYEYFPLTRFLQQHRTLYRQVAAGEKVEIPQSAPGAGSRFHG